MPEVDQVPRLLENLPIGVWVAIAQDFSHVVTYGDDMMDVIAEAKKAGESEPYVVRVPDPALGMML